MCISRRLGDEPDVRAVRHPAALQSAAHPRVVMHRHEHTALRRGRIERQQPRVLVVARAQRHERFRAVFGKLHRTVVDLALLRRALLRRLGFFDFFFLLLLLLRLGRRLESRLEPLHFAVRSGDRCELRRVERIAHLLARLNVLGVPALARVVRDRRPLRLRQFGGERHDRVLSIGREMRVADRLLGLELQRLDRLLALLLRLVLLALLRAARDDVEQRLLLRFHELLAGRAFLVVPQRRLVVRADDVRHLLDRSVVERDDEEVVAADEADVALVMREPRIRLGVVRVRQLAMLAVPKHDVAVVDVDGALEIARPIRAHRRRVFLFGFAELAQALPVAVRDVGVEVFLRRIGVRLPMKINVLTIRRPAQIARLPAGQSLPAHDVIDGELRACGESEEKDDERNSLHGAA